jgi:adenylate cyclase
MTQTPPPAAPAPPDPNQVQAQLDRILSSPEFTGSPRLGEFLRCVTHLVLNGNSRSIKQYTIAAEVYGRDSSFNPKVDPLVRVEAGRLRRVLNKYYAGSGRQDSLLIEVPLGTYAPRFVDNAGRTDKAGAARAATAPAVSRVLAMPVVAVWPMKNLGEQRHDYLVNGIGEELTVELSRCAALRVVAYSSTAHLAAQGTGDADAVRHCAGELNAEYVLSGTLRRSGQRLRITIHLIHVDSGEQLWADRFHTEFAPSRMFDIEDRIVRQVLGRVADTYGVISRSQTRQAEGRRIREPSAYEAVLRALHYQLTMTPETFQQALTALDYASRVEPDSAKVWAMLSQCLFDADIFGFQAIPDAIENGIRYAGRAISLDPGCQFAHYAKAYASLLERDRSAMRHAAERIVSINPNAAYMVGCAGFWLCLAGDYQRGMEFFQRGTALNPQFPSWLHAAPFFDSLQHNDYETALFHADEFGLPDFFWGPLMRATVLALLGRSADANKAYRRLLELKPDFADNAPRHVGMFVLDDRLAAKMLDALKRAA